MAIINSFRRAHLGTISREQMVTWQLQGTGTAIGTTPQFYPAISDIVFQVLDTAETISVSATLPGGVTVTPKVYSLSTLLPVTATTLATGSYLIKHREHDQIYTLTFTKSGAVNQGIVSGAVLKQSYNP